MRLCTAAWLRATPTGEARPPAFSAGGPCYVEKPTSTKLLADMAAETDVVLEAVAAVCGGPRDPGPWILTQGLGASLGYQIFRMSIFPDPGLRVRVIAQVCNKLADNVQPDQASRQCHASFLSVPDFLSAARPGCLRALSVSYSKSVLCGAFVWARTPLNGQKWRFPTRADSRR